MQPKFEWNRVLLVVAGVLCAYQAAHLAAEFGWWPAGYPNSLDRVAAAVAAALQFLLLAICLRKREETRDPAPDAFPANDAEIAIPISGTRPTPLAHWPNDPTRDRRRQLRVQIRKPVRVETLNDGKHEFQGHTVDFSGGGLGAIINGPIDRGAPVLVRLEEGLLLGEVTNCYEVAGGFRIGLRVDQLMAGSTAEPDRSGIRSDLNSSPWFVSH